MKKLIVTAFCALSLAASATQYSCLSIITNAKRLGKWPALKAWIVAADLKDEWDKANYVSDDYPQYAAITNALVTGGVLTNAEVLELLATSKDTAIPDNALRRVYNRDVSTSSGRMKWHGKQTVQIIDTNQWIRITRYEDGTEFTDRAAKPKDKIDTMKKIVAKTNGVPVRLAEARRRWAANKNAGGTTNITVNVRAGQ